MVFGTAYCGISHLEINHGDECILLPLGFRMKCDFSRYGKADVNTFAYLYAFIAPPVYVIYGGNPDNSTFLSKYTSDLTPEKVTNVEIGYNYHNKWLDVNGNIYLMTIENEFVSTGSIDPFSGFMIKTPVNSTLRTGIESDGKINLGGKFKSFYTFQYQQNSLRANTNVSESNLRIPFNPNLITSIGTSYKMDGFTVGVIGQYVSSMAMDLNSTQNFSKEYWTLNGFFDYQYNKVNIGFKFNNFLNQKYYIPAGISTGLPTYYVGQLQNWTLSVKYKF